MDIEAYEKRLIAIRRQAVIRPLALKAIIAKHDVSSAALKLDRSERTIREWIKLYRSCPVLDTLMPGHRFKAGRKPRLPQRTLEIIGARIKTDYLGKKEKVTAKSLHELIEEDCLKHDTLAPGLRHIQRCIAALPKLAKAKAKKLPQDPEAFKARPHHYIVERPLAEVQIDHTKADAFLDLEEYGLGNRRVWITLAIDVASRVVFGYYLGLKQPNAATCGLALIQGILPKKKWMQSLGVSYSAFAEHGISDPWPVRGIPEVVSSDNAKEFKSHAFIFGCQQLGIRSKLRPIGRKHYGGHIERLIGHFMGDVHMLPGTSFSNSKERGDYPSQAKAFLTMEDFELWFALNILKYHCSPHKGLHGLTPLQKYDALTDKEDFRARLIPDNYHVRSAFLPSTPRVVSKQGIQFDNYFYWNAQLEDLIGSSVVIKYHPARTNHIWVCLDGITPSFEAHPIDRRFRAQHIDAPVHHMPTQALRQETERQKGVAKMLNRQMADFVDICRRRGRLSAQPKHTNCPKIFSASNGPATLPVLSQYHDPR